MAEKTLYDIEEQRSQNASSDDTFARLYSSFESQIVALLHKSEMAAMEINRAAVVAMNAKVRRTKARLMDEAPKLQKLAQKRVKGLAIEELEVRKELVLALPERIQAIPDGTKAKQTGGWGASTSHKNIKFDSDGQFDDDFFHKSKESNQFRHDYEMRKIKQVKT
ncbi:Syntaxin-71 [Olea europaea subsp. europaea]|uniref:Syntaxin-71 n=1 Tax=Olea europaea subsp. europaea TaxID=158383 RepID=A0A8S0VCS0_OLEEU|nr:Syntaxin-71 [Olea europaea subsp. europaea]